MILVDQYLVDCRTLINSKFSNIVLKCVLSELQHRKNNQTALTTQFTVITVHFARQNTANRWQRHEKHLNHMNSTGKSRGRQAWRSRIDAPEVITCCTNSSPSQLKMVRVRQKNLCDYGFYLFAIFDKGFPLWWHWIVYVLYAMTHFVCLGYFMRRKSCCFSFQSNLIYFKASK